MAENKNNSDIRKDAGQDKRQQAEKFNSYSPKKDPENSTPPDKREKTQEE